MVRESRSNPSSASICTFMQRQLCHPPHCGFGPRSTSVPASTSIFQRCHPTQICIPAKIWMTVFVPPGAFWLNMFGHFGGRWKQFASRFKICKWCEKCHKNLPPLLLDLVANGVLAQLDSRLVLLRASISSEDPQAQLVAMPHKTASVWQEMAKLLLELHGFFFKPASDAVFSLFFGPLRHSSSSSGILIRIHLRSSYSSFVRLALRFPD